MTAKLSKEWNENHQQSNVFCWIEKLRWYQHGIKNGVVLLKLLKKGIHHHGNQGLKNIKMAAPERRFLTFENEIFHIKKQINLTTNTASRDALMYFFQQFWTRNHNRWACGNEVHSSMYYKPTITKQNKKKRTTAKEDMYSLMMKIFY